MGFLRVVYVLAMTAAIVGLVVAAVEAFYPEPLTWPESEVHARNLFLVVVSLGLVLSVVGTLIRRRLNVQGAALILGGLAIMLYAIVPDGLSSVLRFVGITVILLVLIFVGTRIFPSLRKG